MDGEMEVKGIIATIKIIYILTETVNLYLRVKLNLH